MGKTKKSARKPIIARVSKQNWISAALETLAMSGIESVKVERLAKQLGVAKSGFYWHFKDRNALLSVCPEIL